MPVRTNAKKLCDVEARKHPKNLPAIIKIYQWPKVSNLKLREGKENTSTLSFLNTLVHERTKFKIYFAADLWIANKTSPVSHTVNTAASEEWLKVCKVPSDRISRADQSPQQPLCTTELKNLILWWTLVQYSIGTCIFGTPRSVLSLLTPCMPMHLCLPPIPSAASSWSCLQSHELCPWAHFASQLTKAAFTNTSPSLCFLL